MVKAIIEKEETPEFNRYFYSVFLDILEIPKNLNTCRHDYSR